MPCFGRYLSGACVPGSQGFAPHPQRDLRAERSRDRVGWGCSPRAHDQVRTAPAWQQKCHLLQVASSPFQPKTFHESVKMEIAKILPASIFLLQL